MANFSCWDFGGRKKFLAASSIKKMSRFEEVSPEKIKRIAWKFTKPVILLGLAGYELIINNSAYGLVGYIYISTYPACPRRITVKYIGSVLILYCNIIIVLFSQKLTNVRAVKAIHAKMAAHVLMCLGHSSVNAQGNSLALDAKQVCLQTKARSLTDQTTRWGRIQLLTTIFGWLRFLCSI